MNKILRVGDPHIKPNNIKESNDLMQFVFVKAQELMVDRVEILGDLFDTHSIVRLEVLEFWDKWLHTLSKGQFETVVLVGNHDITGNYVNEYSALHPFLNIGIGLKIVHEPYLNGIYGYLPYIHDNEKFVQEANKLAQQGAKVLVSHPNYKGAVYDNGTPIAAGVDPNDLSSGYLQLIGGHIHTELELGRVWYTGNPRWLTKSCANKKKGIWLCTDDDQGNSISREFISTESVCRPIITLKWNEGENKPEIPSNANVNMELIGSSDWVMKVKKDLVGSVSVSSKITDHKKIKERKSGRSLHDFLSNHYQTEPEKKQKLLKYLGDLNFV